MFSLGIINPRDAMPILKPIRGILPNRIHPLGGFVVFWPFNEASGNRVFDLSGNGNSGTGTFVWVPGAYGSSLYFAGTAVLTVSNKPSLDFNTGDFTIAVGVEMGTLGGADFARSLIVHVGSQANNPGYIFNVVRTTGIVRFNVGLTGADANRTYRDGVTAIDDNKPHVIVATWQSATGIINLYLDGVLDNGAYGNQNGSNYDITSDNPLYVGYDGVGLRWPLVGNLDFTYLYNRALSQSEVTLLCREPFCVMLERSAPMRYFSIPATVSAQRSHVGFKPIEGADRLRGLGSNALY